jgi:hypothetical protein
MARQPDGSIHFENSVKRAELLRQQPRALSRPPDALERDRCTRQSPLDASARSIAGSWLATSMANAKRIPNLFDPARRAMLPRASDVRVMPGLPSLHKGNFLLLCLDDVLRQRPHLRILAVFELDLCLVHRSLVMRDHVRHKVRVCISCVSLRITHNSSERSIRPV